MALVGDQVSVFDAITIRVASPEDHARIVSAVASPMRS